MSWPAEHPEEYEELTKQGVHDFVMHEMDKAGFEVFDADVVRMAVDALWDVRLPDRFRAGAFKQYDQFQDVLTELGHAEIAVREADRVGRLIDAAMERRER